MSRVIFERVKLPFVHGKFPASITRLIDALSALPGIGARTAQRLVFHLVRSPDSVSQELGAAASGLKSNLQFCQICRNITEGEKCAVCIDSRRDQTQICVVAEPLDVLAFEAAGAYHGVYHVLHGVLSPLDGVGPEQLTIADFLKRIESVKPTEIILALSPSVEGEATVMYLSRQLQPFGVKLTRLARGLPTGSEVNYADELTLKAALNGRQEF